MRDTGHTSGDATTMLLWDKGEDHDSLPGALLEVN